MTLDLMDIDAAVHRARRQRAEAAGAALRSLWPARRALLPREMRPASPPRGHAVRRVLGWSVDGMLVTALLAFALGFWVIFGAWVATWIG